MFKLKMNFTGEVPDVYFMVNNRSDTLAANKISVEIYKYLRCLIRPESVILNYLKKIDLENDSKSIVLATILLDFQKNFIKLIELSSHGTPSPNAQYYECCTNSVRALQAIQLFLENIITKKYEGFEFSENSYMLMKCLKPEIDYLFKSFFEPNPDLQIDFVNRLNQGIISLGEQVNIDVINLKPSKSLTEGPRSPDACLLQLIVFMKETGLNKDDLINEASKIFKSGVVSNDYVNSLIDKLIPSLSIDENKSNPELNIYINKIKNGLNFIGNKRFALSLAQGGAENIIKDRELDVAKNAVHFDSMFTRLYESSLAFKLEKLLQCSSEFKEKMLNPLIDTLRMIIENTVMLVEKKTTDAHILKTVSATINDVVMSFNKGHELGDVKNVPSPEMIKHHGSRDCQGLDSVAFLQAELKCINEIETQRDNGVVDMVDILQHIALAVRFTNLKDDFKSSIPDGNYFFRNHIAPSKVSRDLPEDRIVGEKIIRRYPSAIFSNYSQTNVAANHFGLTSAGHIKFYPDGFNKNPEKPNFRTHTSFFFNVKIDSNASKENRISEENKFILDQGLLLVSGVSGTVWGKIHDLLDINASIVSSKSKKYSNKINEKLFALQTIVSMVQLGGHSFYEGLWPVKEAISKNIMLKDDMSAKKILSNDAVKTENGLEMSIIARNQMLRFLMSDIQEGEAMCSKAEEEAFTFVQDEFKKHDKYYQKY